MLDISGEPSVALIANGAFYSMPCGAPEGGRDFGIVHFRSERKNAAKANAQ